MNEKMTTPRMWIYIVMLIGGMAWGIHFIYRTLYVAR